MTKRKALGKHHRKGLTLFEIADMFGDEDKARAWIEAARWPDGPRCPHCKSANIKVGVPHKSMTYRCNDCDKKPMFSVRTDTVMQSSKLKYRVWAVGIYLVYDESQGHFLDEVAPRTRDYAKGRVVHAPASPQDI